MSLNSYYPDVTTTAVANQTATTTTTITTTTRISSSAISVFLDFSNHSTSWCDTNDSDVWLLDDPVCTTRYDSIITFALVCAVLSFITLWTIFGNVLVLVALYKYGTLRTMSNCLIGNLAISDFLLATTILPISICNDVLGYWVMGRLACTVWLLADVLYCTASVWGLCTVAFDRYMATVYPVWYHDQRSVEKAVICIVFVWIFSFVISFAPVIGWRHMIPSFFSFNARMNSYECVLFMTSSYVIYSSVGSFIIPLCLMIFMYIRIFTVLHSKSKEIKRKAKREISSDKTRHKMNGHPSILETLNTPNECVVRDFTTTTLISISGLEFAKENENDDVLMETDQLLVPEVTVNTGSLHRIAEDANGKVASFDLDDTAENTHRHHSSTSLNGTPAALTLITIPCEESRNDDEISTQEEFSIPKRRSKSVSVVGTSPPHSKSPSISFLNESDLDRRNSHIGTVIPNSSESGDVRSVNNNSLFLNPVAHRSKSANILSSSEEESVLHSPRLPRRSLPCNLAKFGRNNRMTLSMKRRFELREQRATKRMLLIMACFIVCWMPFVGMYISRSLCSSCAMNTHLVSAIIWLGYVNSSLNPVLYTLFNDDFKMAFKKLLGCKSVNRRRRLR